VHEADVPITHLLHYLLMEFEVIFKVVRYKLKMHLTYQFNTADLV